jgi:formylglycine-generating enzyme required for sulfatase activity
MRGTLPILFDCQFDISPTSKLLTPSIKSEPMQPSFVKQPVVTKPKTGEEFNFEVVTVNAKGKITNRNRHTKTQVIEKVNGVSLEMVYIPSGEFMMGSPKDKGGDREKPQHKVIIKQPFYMGKFPITQAQWQAVMDNNPANFKGKNKPVESISWNDAIAFCEKLTKITGKDYRLPSEAEWEYACRAGTTTPFYFGETITPDLANYNGKSTYGSGPKGIYRAKTIEVGQFPPNAFGLYDMHGNVWEWVADGLHDDYKGAPSDGRVWKGGNESFRVLRGGSWYFIPTRVRTANRFWSNPDFRIDVFGFRVAARAF